MRRHTVVIALLFAPLGSCGSPTEPDLSGNLVLFRFGSLPLPVQIDELPNGNGQPSGCWNTLTQGSLNLSRDQGAFSYDTFYRDSCDGHILSVVSASGTFTQTGRDLLFRISGQNGDVTFPGTIVADTIVMTRAPGYLYAFMSSP
jgi:hypothetical protein